MRYLIIVAFLFNIAACKDAAPKYPQLDLMQYGLPIDISAPADAVVVKGDLGVMQDVTVTAGDGFDIQIFGSDATTVDAAKLKATMISEVKGSPFFSKIVEEGDNGFIYEKKIDDLINYDFRVVKIQADKEYMFQTALVGTYTEEQVRDMYEAVK